MAAIAASLFLGERLTGLRLVGLVIGVAGVALASWTHLTDGSDPRGILAALGAAVAWTVASVLLKRHLSTLPPIWMHAWQCTVAALVLMPVSFKMEPLRPVPLTLPLALNVIWLTLGCIALAYVLWFHVLSRNSSTAASSYVFLTPVFGVFFSGWFLGEALTLRLLLALATVAAGIYLVNQPVPKPQGAGYPRSEAVSYREQQR